MKKVFFPALIVLFLLSAGCANRDYVRQQIEPLVERISKLEAKSCQPCPAERAKAPQDCCDKADAAAKRAEDAAARAEAAAEKSKKAFELQQVK